MATAAWRADPLAWGTGGHRFEVFLEPTCPFSARTFGKLWAFLDHVGEKRVTLRVAPEVALYFVEQEARRFSELEKRFKLQIDLKDDPQLKRGDMKVFTHKKQELTKQVVGAVPMT